MAGMGCVLMDDFADALLMVKAGHPELAGWWGKLLGGSGGGGGGAGKVYGVEWDYSSPSPKLTRIGDAAGFPDPVPATSLTGTGSSPFDRVMPWAGMRMCNIIGGEAAYWQGDPQFSETDYDTMVFIPEFWYKAEKDTNASKWRWSISPSEKDGYAKHPGSGRYIGRFHSSGSSAGVYSKADAMPLASTTRSDYRTYSHGKGTKWWMLDIATWSALQLLYLIEFADFDSQTVLELGQSSGDVVASGGTSGAVYHTLKRSGESNQYRWVEDPYSNGYIWIDGLVASSRVAYVGTDNARFSDDTTYLTNTGITLPASAYATGFGFSSAFPWALIPDTSGGSSDTYVTDYVFSNANHNDKRALSGGGRSGGTLSQGLFCFNAANSGEYNATYLSSRLIFIP